VSLLDDGFRRSESELLATWIITGKSTLDARLARVDYHSSHFASGTSPVPRTARISMDATQGCRSISCERDLQPWQDDFTSYRVDKRLSFGPRCSSVPGPRWR